MRKSILKTLLVLAIASGCIWGLFASAAGTRTAQDGTTFTTTSGGGTTIDRSARGGGVTQIDGKTGRATTTSN